jgi:predicted TIM-barrel fold metal-dependent hydrolase
MDAYPNIYGDLSAGSGANALSRDMSFAKEFVVRRQDRLMFGTDYLSPGQGVPQFELFNKKLELPSDVQAKVFRDNARKLLGLA